MNFKNRMLPTKLNYQFREEGYHVWCGSAFQFRGNCYFIYSRWKKDLGFAAWVTDSEICLAKADHIFGEFHHVKTLFGKDEDDRWDASCKHNPTVLKYEDKIYLYYMGNRGNGEWWNHRNNQRIGCAVASDPEGEWRRKEEPVIDVSSHGFDSLMTSNPTVTQMPDGRVLAVYKGVSKEGELPKGGPVICGVAIAEHPEGPFIKEKEPIMQNPNHPWSVEDPFIWREDGNYYSLVKDFHGYFTKTNGYSVALFESRDGIHWAPSDTPLAFTRELVYEDGQIQKVALLERPQLYFENGTPKALLCACAADENCTDTFHVRIPLK
ncbi:MULTISPECIES: glycoside hydrolase family protein [Congzhengia]|jgi:hypothetical protein|uniref:Glycoside hydrolase family protein n=1 Tax=Congzhengia minquanensis TaxID=2763657 RepID=A0A926DLA9_9FIRM|nr:glycoside hydrolase family protein [Congzhengia minquanensis]MBC8541045.1 glycoside hydrolase family protein [Congzhengia minquanensis]